MKKRQKTNEPTQRQLRVGEQVRHALAEIFMRQECFIPAIDGVSVTVSEVRVSPDLKHANVYISPLNGDIDEVLKALAEEASQLRHAVSVRLNHMKSSAPRLFFRYDDTFDEAMKISQLLNRDDVQRDLDTES